ncbi:energy transducer TonB [Sphingomonas sp. SM33]|uniref:Energy transducer TonB n=1 Tax=Sphingomonas telluris TaxID=2907998 RepID=A0ABS9VLA3_9SPHN|nr:energy transducer TonB [Sphingomonas telluris]MCH8615750.1 energy transducer TonB [Sphingomonas telluris]
MRLRVIALAAIGVSSTSFAASAPKQPSGKWIVNFADAQCVATRNYGSEEDPFYLVLKAPAVGDVLQLGLVRKGATDEATQIDAEILFDESAPVRTSLLDFGNRKLNQRAMMANLPAKQLSPLTTAKTLRIRAREDGVSTIGTRLAVNTSRADEAFTLAQMTAVLKALDTCAADLRKIWKVWDYEKGGAQAGLKQGPTGDLVRLFDADDYPAISILKGQIGDVGFVLLIDELGKVADCTVIRTSGVAALDAQSCAIVKARGKFKPAVGLDDKPSKSAWFQRVRWALMR